MLAPPVHRHECLKSAGLGCRGRVLASPAMPGAREGGGAVSASQQILLECARGDGQGHGREDDKHLPHL